METKWIWVVAIVCLVVFLTAISRHRKIPGLEDCFQCPHCGCAFEVSPVVWAFRRSGEKSPFSNALPATKTYGLC